MNRRLVCFCIWIAALAATGCGVSAPSVALRGNHFAVEVADTDASRARGLMFREALPAQSGMLFIFADESQRSFWMHNCKIALDILYFDANQQLVGQALSVPPCSLPPEQCPNYPSGRPTKYVLELNAGVAQQLGVKLGDVLTIKLP